MPQWQNPAQILKAMRKKAFLIQPNSYEVLFSGLYGLWNYTLLLTSI